MGTTCYKSKKSINRVANQTQEITLTNPKETSPNQVEEDLKEKQMAKLSTNLPPINNHIIDQLVTQKSIKEENMNMNIMPLERSKQGSIRKFKHKNMEVRETIKINYSTGLDGGKMINNYKILESLGEGSFGKVKLCVKKMLDLEKKYAMKIFKKSKLMKIRTMKKNANGGIIIHDALEDVMKEIAVMKKLDHPNVIRLHEVLYGEEKGKLYLVLDYASQGQMIEWEEEESCFYYVKNPSSHELLTEEFLRPIFRECLLGLYYLHYNHIVHRDIKPQNILFTEDGTAKLADFGLSELCEGGNDQMDSTEGTYFFMAPEMFKIKKGVEGKPLDIWALGVSYYAFLYLKLPFYGDNMNEMIKSITENDVVFPNERNMSPELKEIMTQMLEKDPQKRIKIEDLVKKQWFNQGMEPLEDIVKYITKVNLSDQDYENVVIPLERVVFIKSVIKKLRQSVIQNRSSSLPKSHSIDELGSPINQNQKNLNILGEMNINVKSEVVITNVNPLAVIKRQDSKPRRDSLFKNKN